MVGWMGPSKQASTHASNSWSHFLSSRPGSLSFPWAPPSSLFLPKCAPVTKELSMTCKPMAFKFHSSARGSCPRTCHSHAPRTQPSPSFLHLHSVFQWVRHTQPHRPVRSMAFALYPSPWEMKRTLPRLFPSSPPPCHRGVGRQEVSMAPSPRSSATEGLGWTATLWWLLSEDE